MDRRIELLKDIRREDYGIEIGPYWNPLVPRSDGYNSISFDVFTAEELRDQYSKLIPNNKHLDPLAIDNIEEVDLIGSAQDIASIVNLRFPQAKFDYIISSHNLEHFPDPITFLNGCASILKPHGLIRLALPDHRCCFDYFRPVTIAADWIEAFFEKRQRPTGKQVFLKNAMRASLHKEGQLYESFDLSAIPSNVKIDKNDLKESLSIWKAMLSGEKNEYIDTHCWVFTPHSFKLIMIDLIYLELLPLSVKKISQTNGNEFYVSLINSAEHIHDDFYKVRSSLFTEFEI